MFNVASLTYDSDSSIDEVNPAKDAIISELLRSNLNKKIFLLTALEGLLEVTLRESTNDAYPRAEFLEMFHNDEKRLRFQGQEFVRLGDTREADDNDFRLRAWYRFVFPTTFPKTLYIKDDLEKKINLNTSFNTQLTKVTIANDKWVYNMLTAVDLTGDDNQLHVLKF